MSEMRTPPVEQTDQPVGSRLHPEVLERARKVIADRYLPDDIPEGWPAFDLEVSDGCTGVRQLAQHCCAIHDADYWYGRTWRDKLLADWRLMTCIWRHGRDRMSADYDPDPWSTAPAWFMLSFSRGIGVALFAWRAFYKPYKRKGWKPPAPPPTGESIGLK